MKLNVDRKAVKALTVGLVAACAATQARAAFVDYEVGDGGLVGGFTGSIDGTAISGGASFLAGGIDLTKESGGAGLPATYTTLCTDIGGTLFLGETYGFNAPALFTSSGVAPSTWGANSGSAAAAIQNAAQLFYQDGIFGGVLGGSDANAKAGLQLAVWEALYDTGNTLGVGTGLGTRFQVAGSTTDDATAVADANADLVGLTGLYNFQGYILVPNPLVPSGQTDPAQELLIGAGDFTPAPEPATYAAMTAGCAVVCLVALRRKTKRSGGAV
jgi:hypothetical protein